MLYNNKNAQFQHGKLGMGMPEGSEFQESELPPIHLSAWFAQHLLPPNTVMTLFTFLRLDGNR